MKILKQFPNVGVEAQTDKVGKIDLLHFKKVGEPFSLQLIFDFGAFVEDKKGSAHFLEHMLVSGTEKYKTKKELADQFDKRGCFKNAWTSPYSLVLSQDNNDLEDLDFSLEMLEQFVFCSIFDSITLENERNVIFDEISMTEKEKSKTSYYAFMKMLFPKTAFEIDTKGTRESLASITKTDLLATRESLVRSRKVLVTTGDFDLSEISTRASDFLENLSKYDNNLQPTIKIKARTGEFTVEHPLKVSGIGVFFDRTVYGNIKNEAIIGFLGDLLFGQNGLLIEKLRFEKGLTYAVRSETSCTNRLDYWGVFVESAPENISKVKETINQIVFSEIYEKITTERLRDYVIKTRRKERRIYRDAEIFADEYGWEFLLHGTELAWHDTCLDILEKISPEEVSILAKEIFKVEGQSIVIFKS